MNLEQDESNLSLYVDASDNRKRRISGDADGNPNKRSKDAQSEESQRSFHFSSSEESDDDGPPLLLSQQSVSEVPSEVVGPGGDDGLRLTHQSIDFGNDSHSTSDESEGEVPSDLSDMTLFGLHALAPDDLVDSVEISFISESDQALVSRASLMSSVILFSDSEASSTSPLPTGSEYDTIYYGSSSSSAEVIPASPETRRARRRLDFSFDELSNEE